MRSHFFSFFYIRLDPRDMPETHTQSVGRVDDIVVHCISLRRLAQTQKRRGAVFIPVHARYSINTQTTRRRRRFEAARRLVASTPPPLHGQTVRVIRPLFPLRTSSHPMACATSRGVPDGGLHDGGVGGAIVQQQTTGAGRQSFVDDATYSSGGRGGDGRLIGQRFVVAAQRRVAAVWWRGASKRGNGGGFWR